MPGSSKAGATSSRRRTGPRTARALLSCAPTRGCGTAGRNMWARTRDRPERAKEGQGRPSRRDTTRRPGTTSGQTSSRSWDAGLPGCSVVADLLARLRERPVVGGTSRGGTGQSQPSTRRQTTPETDSGATLRPSPRTPEELRATAPQERRTSSSRIYNRGGGEAQRDADFQALGPIRTERDERGVVTGYLPDGRRIVSRPSTQDRERRPTLELQRPDGKVTDKFRY